ncbi:MAG: serine/threonine-protein kinase [Betaproteobacteria bacterium]|nr:serine/threonine-protein kinase [Betaproteobacteria bacterium]
MKQIPKTIGEYRIVREIGNGATATVYEAKHPGFPGSVAVKHIRFGDSTKDGAKLNRRLLKLLRAEKAVAQRLDHPNIIKIHEVVAGRKQAYVVMEYFSGTTLEQYCSFEHRLPVHRVTGIIFKCCMALDYAYRQGIVHRDIKPANILIDEKDDVRITDFGLALNVDKSIEADSTFIMGVGSPAYMSPEQVKNYPLNQKTDLYSLGVVMFHLLAGRLPFRAANQAQLVYKIINTDPPLASHLNPDVSEQMDVVIRKAMEKDLYSRYKNGAEFAKDLSAARFKIFDEDDAQLDTVHFSMLRRQAFFTEFDDVELWEVLRISVWRNVSGHVRLIKEGDTEQRFGVLLEGRVELSIAGRRVMELGSGTIFGESAWLDRINHRQTMSAVSLEPLTYLEINPAALMLATEEVQEAFRHEVASVVTHRLGALALIHSEHCGAATEATTASTGSFATGMAGWRLVGD